MSLLQFANFGSTQLAGAISNVATVANLISGSGALFPEPSNGQYFVAEFNDQATGLEYEVVWVTGRMGDTITMIRGQEGTSALTWQAGDLFFSGPTAGQMGLLVQGLTYEGNPNGNVAGAAAGGGLPPTVLWDTVDEIWWTCTTSGDAATAVWLQVTGEIGVTPALGAFLEYTSATELTLVPNAGGYLWINGTNYAVSSPTVSNSGLADSTWYYVYAFIRSGSMALEAVSTAPVQESNGVWQKTGDPTHTWVGAALTNGSAEFQAQGTGTFTLYGQQLEVPWTYFSVTPGTYSVTVPPTKARFRDRVWGGGGGGCFDSGAGASGAGGGYSEGWFALTLGILTTISITVGAGGASANAPPAGTGGTSSVGSYNSATGGTGGAAGSVAGGTGTGGQINLTGQGSVDIDDDPVLWAPGGSAPMGGLGGNVNGAGTQMPPTPPGGGGGVNSNNNSPENGAAGGVYMEA